MSVSVPTGDGRARLRAALAVLPALLPGAAVVFLAFQAGGFFPQSYGALAALLAVALALRVVTVARPFAGLSVWSAVAAGALALLGVWMLLSAQWSHSGARAMTEFVRLLMYLLMLLVCASLAPRERRLAWALRGAAVGIAVVCAAALLSRLRVDLVSVPPGFVASRLDYPLTYWNGLGLLSGIGFVLALHLCASTREPYAVRVLAAPLAPIAATTTYLTLSRGGIVATVVAVLAYVVLGRPRGLPGAALAIGISTLVVVRKAYAADLLVTDRYSSPAGVAQGRSVFTTLLVMLALAMVIRFLALALDILADRYFGRIRVARPVAAGAWVAAIVVAVGLGLALGAPGYAHRQVHAFLTAPAAPPTQDVRRRLTVLNNSNGRIDDWKVALKAFRSEPLHGTGAGTYATQWSVRRPVALHVLDAHSLYIETLGDLGIVGFALVVVAVGSILLGLAWRLRGADRPAAAAVLAATLAWAVHAGVDWDWELTATSVWVFGLAGIALVRLPAAEAVKGTQAAAQATAASPRAGLARALRVPVALAVLLLGVAPFQLWRSDGRLAAAQTAFRAGNCPGAIDAALGSLSAVGARPEPWQLIAYCDVRLGQAQLAVGAANAAVTRDPDNWEWRYTLALVRGAFRLDPRPAAAAALRLDPLGEKPRRAVKAFRTARPAAWDRRARRLPL